MGFIEHLAPRRLSGRASGIPMYAPISLNGGIALSPATIERPRQRNPGICPDIIEWVYRAVSPAAPKRPRQRNPDV